MNLIDRINKLSQSEFLSIFGNIFEHSEWIAMETYYLKPFNNFDDLCFKMINIFNSASEKEQLKIICAHPDLANKAKIGKHLTSESRKEQVSANLYQCSKEEYEQFKKLNKSYKKKFCFPFILSVKNKDKIEILNNFKQRITNKTDDEFKEAIKQVKKIANLRLIKLNLKEYKL